MQPTIKRLWVSITLVTLVGIMTTWLSSCSNTEAAADNNNNPDLHIVLNQSVQDIRTQVTDASLSGSVQNKLDAIMGTLGGTGGGGGQAAGSFSELVQLTGDLSKEIGKMSLQIGLMADRIVETEKLIVSVIGSQTAAASAIIATSTYPDPAGGAPISITESMPNFPTEANLVSFADIQAGINGGGGVLLAASPIVAVVGYPAVKIGGAPPTNPYQLLVSTDAMFSQGNTVNQIVDPNSTPPNSTTIATVWPKIVGRNGLNLAQGNTVFVAVKTINGTSVSGLSNSVELIIP